MSFTSSLENLTKLCNINLGKQKKHRGHDQNRRNCIDLPYDSNSSSNYGHVKTHRRGKKINNKRNNQIAEDCRDVGFSDTKQFYVYQDPVSLMRQCSITNDSDTDLDFIIQYNPTEFNKDATVSNISDASLDALICLNRNGSSQLVFGKTNISKPTDNIHDRIKNNHILQECCEKAPYVDEQMIEDLKKAFDYPPQHELGKLVSYVQNLPYDKHSRIPSENQAIKSFRRKRGFSTQELILYLRQIGKEILIRCSYGFLVISKNKKQFLAVRNSHGQHRWGAPKGHPKIETNGYYETPFKAAVREINEEIHYWDSKCKQYCTLNEKLLKDSLIYLECVLKDDQAKYRRIGLFVYCLQDDYEFFPKDFKEIDDVKWYGIEENIDPSEFYTLYPFVEYLRNHPEIIY